ncbi:hypothetical protein OS493_034759 [Desmophyllum pertusum]|uniref:Uncharacterized protein n=1 Tax=Desmophyllum pertusum TaxID=174260 RepID=A0A9W9YV61_9CNID|nr:hypothetical protein OS493_034759 [Desmophyllum pertusum]
MDIYRHTTDRDFNVISQFHWRSSSVDLFLKEKQKVTRTWSRTITNSSAIFLQIFTTGEFVKAVARRNDREFGLNIPPTAYFSDELSEEELIFDQTAMEHKKESTKSADHAIHEQKT